MKEIDDLIRLANASKSSAGEVDMAVQTATFAVACHGRQARLAGIDAAWRITEPWTRAGVIGNLIDDMSGERLDSEAVAHLAGSSHEEHWLTLLMVFPGVVRHVSKDELKKALNEVYAKGDREIRAMVDDTRGRYGLRPSFFDRFA
jgi:hypothetical protein